MTDSKGRTVDFTNTVIILTSNVGAEYLLNLSQESQAKDLAHAKVMAQVQRKFAPEFLNRLSAVVMFNALGSSQLVQIVQKSMKGVSKRLATRGVRVVLESSGAKAVLAASFDPNYGARPVERYLESTVVTTLSRMLISGELTSGSLVHIEAIEMDDESYDDLNVPLRKKAKLQYRIERSESNVGESDDANFDEIMED